MNILVRLPNWLGDVVMSLAFLDKLKQTFPLYNIEVIIKKGLEPIIQDHPVITLIHAFDKKEFKGLAGVRRFGKKLSSSKKYDLFFCLPDSFSSAAMAFATGAMHRIGYKNEWRSLLLTHNYKKPAHLHRVEEYCALIDMYLGKRNLNQNVIANRFPSINTGSETEKYVVANFNSEAISRRMPVQKAADLLGLLQAKYNLPIKLTGGANDVAHVKNICNQLVRKNGVENIAGKTSLYDLMNTMHKAWLVVSVDSGAAHIAAALRTPLVVICGAGNEANTGPYKNNTAIVVRHGMLPCEPCVKNTCKLAPLPVCLTELDLNKVMEAVAQLRLQRD